MHLNETILLLPEPLQRPTPGIMVTPTAMTLSDSLLHVDHALHPPAPAAVGDARHPDGFTDWMDTAHRCCVPG
jgi:hypothetical protein